MASASARGGGGGSASPCRPPRLLPSRNALVRASLSFVRLSMTRITMRSTEDMAGMLTQTSSSNLPMNRAAGKSRGAHCVQRKKVKRGPTLRGSEADALTRTAGVQAERTRRTHA